MSARAQLYAVFAAFTIALAALYPSDANATMMVEVPLRNMIAEADAIVIGRVVESDVIAVVRDDGLEPQTVTRIQVTEWLKGEGGATVSLREIGGVLPQGNSDAEPYGVRVAGTPEYPVGQEVVVFLGRRPEDGSFRTFAFAQGKFRIRRAVPGAQDVAIRDISGVGFVEWGANGQEPHGRFHGPTRLPLGDLKLMVQEVLATLETATTSSATGETE